LRLDPSDLGIEYIQGVIEIIDVLLDVVLERIVVLHYSVLEISDLNFQSSHSILNEK